MLTVTGALLPDAAAELDERGFVVLPAVVAPGSLAELSAAYDEAVASAIGDDLRVGSTTTRVHDLVNRGAAFDDVYVFPPLIEAAVRVIEGPFKLSSLMARTLRPHQPEQELHVDVERDSADWPLVGFILMIDDFRPDNGATRFVPGSHRSDLRDRGGYVLACGTAGSLLIFNASTWHGHSANTTDLPRRSIQGFFVPRDGRAGTDFFARMTGETRARLCPLAQYLLTMDGAPG
jgi:hypothetical protein